MEMMGQYCGVKRDWNVQRARRASWTAPCQGQPDADYSARIVLLGGLQVWLVGAEQLRKTLR
jgi:hypothetical protein